MWQLNSVDGACVHVIDSHESLSSAQSSHTSQEAQERGSFLATQLIWTVCLLTLTYLRLCSALKCPTSRLGAVVQLRHASLNALPVD